MLMKQLDKLESEERNDCSEAITRDVRDAVVLSTRLEYLKLLTISVLEELASLDSLRGHSEGHHFTLSDEVRRFESELIRNALTVTHGKQRRAAHLLGMNATTLNTKLKRLDSECGQVSGGRLTTPVSESEALDEGLDLGHAEAMQQFEVDLLKRALKRSGGNQTKAARVLGIPVSTLNTKIKKFGIDISAFTTYRDDHLIGFSTAESVSTRAA